MCFKIYSSSPLSVYNDLNEDLKKINTIQKMFSTVGGETFVLCPGLGTKS